MATMSLIQSVTGTTFRFLRQAVPTTSTIAPHRTAVPFTRSIFTPSAGGTTKALSQSIRQLPPNGLTPSLPILSSRLGLNGSLCPQESVRGFKVHSSVRRRCSGCKSVRRRGHLYIICSKNKKHKQRQG